MSIWTFKRYLVVATCVFLFGCEQTGDMGFMSPATPKPGTALSKAVMAGGAIALVPPEGYCIDKSSLRPQFALMARCDVLGAGRAPANVPLALITASTVPMKDGAAAPSASELSRALGKARVLQVQDRAGLALVQAVGDIGLDGLGDRYWRGAFSVNGVLVGLALYAPQNGGASGTDGAKILNRLAQRTKQQTAVHSVALVQPKTSVAGNTD
jgi:hypothetical protein